MAKRTDKQMTEDELSAVVEQEVTAAQGSDSNLLSRQRASAMEYYLGEPYGTETQDKSAIVTREVLNTIEWIKPELMKIFASGSETVRFEPQNVSDVEQAQQATDYINYLFHRKNPGFTIIYEWLTDGLLQKNGIVKIWYDTEASKQREEYEGLSQMEFQMLVMGGDIEVVEHEVVEAEGNVVEGQPPVPPTYNCVIVRTGACSGVKLAVIPPEEFLISRKAKTIKDSPFCAHRTRMTISDLTAMGFSSAKLENISSSDSGAVQFDDEVRARHRHDDTHREEQEINPPDPSMREVWVIEAYIRTDFNQDGIAELRKVIQVGGTVLSNEEVDCMPFAGWTPIMISHKFHGLSMADLVMDLQKIQSQLMRNLLDNQYLTNNGRYEAVEGMVNLDDLLTSRPHGVVRTKMAGAVRRLDVPQLGQTAFQMLDYVDNMVEKRTGVSERSQGLDPNLLSANTTMGATSQVMTAAQQRIELIARVFGETGLTDAFRIMYKLVIQNQTAGDMFRLRDKYVEVDPSSWIDRNDVSVVVGLGNGSKETEMMQLGQLFQEQQQLMNNPQAASLVQPVNVYNLLEDQVKVFNKAQSGRYFTDPTSEQAMQQQQQQQEQQMQQMQQQQAMIGQQMELQKGELELTRMKIQLNDENEKAALEIKQRAQGLEEKDQEEKVMLKTTELEMEYELEKDQGRGVSLG